MNTRSISTNSKDAILIKALVNRRGQISCDLPVIGSRISSFSLQGIVSSTKIFLQHP